MKYTGRVFILSASLSVVLRVVCLCVCRLRVCDAGRASHLARLSKKKEILKEGNTVSGARFTAETVAPRGMPGNTLHV